MSLGSVNSTITRTAKMFQLPEFVTEPPSVWSALRRARDNWGESVKGSLLRKKIVRQEISRHRKNIEGWLLNGKRGVKVRGINGRNIPKRNRG